MSLLFLQANSRTPSQTAGSRMPAAVFSSSLLSLPTLLSPPKPTPSSSSSSSSSSSYSLPKLSSRSPPSSSITSSRRSCASRRFYSPQGDRQPLPFAPLTGDPEAKGDAWDPSQHEALLNGGEQVVSVLQEMLKLLEDMEMDEASEPMAVEIVAQGVIGKRVDEMESGFMMALDYMIQIADKDHDEQRKSILEVIKQTVLDHLTKKCPPHVQVIGLLCQTPQKESRHELLRRVAAGGGVFKSEKGLKVQLPGANLNDIADQADDLLESMESRPTIPDRKLLARLVLVREEAQNMMGGGLLDERNDRGLSTLPEAEVNFLSKLVALRLGETVQKMISDVMHGKDEGADNLETGDNEGADNLETGDNEDSDGRQKNLSGVAGRGSVTGRRPRPVRPGMFLETVSKVLCGIYAGNVSGITAQHLEWVHQKTLQILQEMAY